MPLPVVYAYTDRGVLMPDSRWEPHKVLCTTTPTHMDRPGVMFAVKFCAGVHGAAAMISEVFCAHIFRAAGIFTLDTAIVRVSENFAESWNATTARFKITAGASYFGTTFRTDVGAGPPVCLDDVEDPQQLVNIWVMDSLVCNLDRDTEGNTLLLPVKTKFRVIASDQSDCFCGAESFCAPDLRQRMASRGASECKYVVEAIAMLGGKRAVGKAIDSAQQSLKSIPEACGLVPDEWWNNSGLRPHEITHVLTERANRLAHIVNLKEWGELDYGGIVLL